MFGLLTKVSLILNFSLPASGLEDLTELLLQPLASGLKVFLWACSEKIVSEFVWKKGVLIVWLNHCGVDTYLHTFVD
jgi:hypothetical protein